MKRLLLFLISLAVGVLLFIWIGKTIGWREIGDAFKVFNYKQALIILGLTFLIMFLGNYKWLEILKAERVKISFWELLSFYFCGFALMFLAPIVFFGGEFFRGYALKKKEFLSWPKAMASVIIDRVLELTVTLVVILSGIVSFLFLIGMPPVKLEVVFGGVFLLLVIGIGFFYFKSIKKESIVGFFLRRNTQPLETEKEIFNFFKWENPLMWRVIVISFLKAGAAYLRAWFLLLFLGERLGYLPVLSTLGFYYLAITIPIPAALGSHEAIQTFAFSAWGLKASTATAFTLITRAADLTMALIGVAIIFHFGVNLLKNTLNNNGQTNNNGFSKT